jgi:hypothetical protein
LLGLVENGLELSQVDGVDFGLVVEAEVGLEGEDCFPELAQVVVGAADRLELREVLVDVLDRHYILSAFKVLFHFALVVYDFLAKCINSAEKLLHFPGVDVAPLDLLQFLFQSPQAHSHILALFFNP